MEVLSPIEKIFDEVENKSPLEAFRAMVPVRFPNEVTKLDVPESVLPFTKYANPVNGVDVPSDVKLNPFVSWLLFVAIVVEGEKYWSLFGGIMKRMVLDPLLLDVLIVHTPATVEVAKLNCANAPLMVVVATPDPPAAVIVMVFGDVVEMDTIPEPRKVKEALVRLLMVVVATPELPLPFNVDEATKS